MSATFNFLCCAFQTREQEELEELLLLEQQGSEQRRLEVLQDEQRQLQAKRKNRQTLLDELVRNTQVTCVDIHTCPQFCFISLSLSVTHTLSLRVHGSEIIKDYYHSLCYRLHCSHSVILKPLGSIVLSCGLWR